MAVVFRARVSTPVSKYNPLCVGFLNQEGLDAIFFMIDIVFIESMVHSLLEPCSLLFYAGTIAVHMQCLSVIIWHLLIHSFTIRR